MAHISHADNVVTCRFFSMNTLVEIKAYKGTDEDDADIEKLTAAVERAMQTCLDLERLF